MVKLDCNFNTGPYRGLISICLRYNHLINITLAATRDFSDIYHKKFENVRKQQTINSWIRQKRSLFPVIGDALGYLFGTSSKEDLNDVKERYEVLNQKLQINSQHAAILKKELIGLSQIVQTRSENVNKAFEQMSERLEEIEEELNFSYSFYKNLSYTQTMTNVLAGKLNDVIINSLIDIYNLMLYGLTLEDFEEALIQMRRGLLPPNIITPETLKSVLKTVQESVSPLYTIGIPLKNIDFYYIFPLTRFSLLEDGILLKLSIPLQTINTETQYNILKPMSNPIPCNQKFCQWNGRIESNDTYITLSLRDRCWLTDHDNMELLGEIDLSTLSCISISGNNLCYSMDRSLIQTVTSCSHSLWFWDNNFVRKYCNFELSIRENYQPIRMSINTWILHKDVINNYDIICEKMRSKSGAKSRALSSWAEQVSVQDNCYLRTDKFILYGPLTAMDNRLDSVINKPPIFLFDNKFEGVLDDNSDDENFVLDNFERKPKFDKKKMNNYLTLDQMAITKVVDNIYSLTDSIDYELNEYSIDRQNTRNFITWQTTLNSLTKISLFFTLSVVVIILIRTGYGFFGIPPIILTEMDGVECARIVDRNTVRFWESFSSDPYSTMLNMTLLMIGVLLFYVTYRFKYFRTLRHSMHYCIIENPNCNNFLIISFKYVNYSSFRPFMREIIMHYPIDCLNDWEENAEIKVIGNNRLWQITPRNNETVFRLLAPVKLHIKGNGGISIKHQKVSAPIQQFVWRNGGKPQNIVNWNTFGDCSVVAHRESSLTRSTCF